jgi:hypothetical protein
MPGQAEQALECGGDAHAALLREPLTIRQPAACSEGGGASPTFCTSSEDFSTPHEWLKRAPNAGPQAAASPPKRPETLKLRLVGPGDELLGVRDLPPQPEDVAGVVAALGQGDAVGHRIVHGGERFREATLIDADVEAALRELTALVPCTSRSPSRRSTPCRPHCPRFRRSRASTRRFTPR